MKEYIYYAFFLIGGTLLWTGCAKDTYEKEMIDERDGERYALIKIGSQIWMAENLRYNETGSRINPSNPSSAYGRLYTWDMARNACPEGWHLPSDEEWNTMESTLSDTGEMTDLGGRGTHGLAMRSTEGWNFDYNGSNSSNFNVFPAGLSRYSVFEDLGHRAYFWTSTEGRGTYVPSDQSAWIRSLVGSYEEVVFRDDFSQKTNYYSCRCVKN